MHRQHHGPEDGDADLAAVGVAGEDPVGAEFVQRKYGVGVVREGDDRLISIDVFEGCFGGIHA